METSPNHLSLAPYLASRYAIEDIRPAGRPDGVTLVRLVGKRGGIVDVWLRKQRNGIIAGRLTNGRCNPCAIQGNYALRVTDGELRYA
jgi:hypothetical protein